jgi:proteasome accessory factor B
VVTVDAAFEPLMRAVRERRAVAFDYRTPDDDAPAGRRLQPWGVVCWRGRWYVVGHDLDRKAERCFRLSRIVGTVRRTGGGGAFAPPTDIDLITYVARWSGPVERTGRATVLIRTGRGAGVRRWAVEVDTGAEPGWDRVTLRYADPEGFASWLVGYGADVVVLDPPEVRAAAVSRLREIAVAHRDAADRAALGADRPEAARPGPERHSRAGAR